MSGLRVREREMLELGMSLPALASRATAIASLPPLGLLTLAALTPEGWETTLHECEGGVGALAHRLALDRPDLVAISALTPSINDAYVLADALRAEGIRVVIGGLHATAMPHEVAEHADAAVIGDGEPVWPDLLGDAAADRLRPLYQAPRPFDLCSAPVPRFDLVDGRPRPRYTIQTARGCPLACDFCGASRLLGPFREKPVELIEQELSALTGAHGARTIELADDHTFVGRRDPLPLLAAFERAGVRWFTEADWRIGERPALLDRLAASGCVQVLIGVETLVPRHAGMGAKAAPLSRVMDAVAAIQDRGVAVIGCFVVGGDGEDFESLHALGEFLVEAPFADLQLTLETPFPGTGLRVRLGREGRLLRDRGWEACTLFDVAFRPDRMSVEQLESGFRNLVRMVFAHGPSGRRAKLRRRIWGRREEVL